MAWEEFEAHCAELLGLEQTVHSGSRWHDPGDAIDRSHHSETDFPLLIDAKWTARSTFTIGHKQLGEWVRRAGEMGRRFAMPIRLADRATRTHADYIVLRLDDFAEILDRARENEKHA
jgi:hypothetical protein